MSRAAERGVKVRLILDDLSTILNDESHPKLRDQTMALLNSHPNIEIRLFNAWHQRGIAGRGVEMLTQMERINHRMHNKQIIADNRATIIGGRNLGNEYFGLSPEFNFLDLDVIGVGPVARQASGAQKAEKLLVAVLWPGSQYGTNDGSVPAVGSVSIATTHSWRRCVPRVPISSLP